MTEFMYVATRDIPELGIEAGEIVLPSHGLVARKITADAAERIQDHVEALRPLRPAPASYGAPTGRPPLRVDRGGAQ